MFLLWNIWDFRWKWFNGLRYDGCDEVTLRMQEAKGPGTEWLFERYHSESIGIDYYNNIMRQAKAQNNAAIGRGVDWYFADPAQAAFFASEFKSKHFDEIIVHHVDPIVKKLEEYIVWVKRALKFRLGSSARFEYIMS